MTEPPGHDVASVDIHGPPRRAVIGSPTAARASGAGALAGDDRARAGINASPRLANADARMAGIASGGRPLTPWVRRAAERVLDSRLPDVRIHTGGDAGTAAGVLGARAFTIGRDVVLGSGFDQLQHPQNFTVLTHELAHTLQQRSAAPGAPAALSTQRWLERDADQALLTPGRAPTVDALRHHEVQRFPTTLIPPPWPIVRAILGEDVVFIMGQDRAGDPNTFFTHAERYYRARVPGATFVTDVRTLDGVLAWVRDNVPHFINQLYIVSHANEDGTLSFGLDAADAAATGAATPHLDVNELREALHPSAGGPSTLADASAKIDQFSRVHIKGCDLGRTQSIVELIDEAFGGRGTVTAPTHEQVYGSDPTLGAQARTQFNQAIADSHAMPDEVDPSLRGADRAAATRARRTALAERRQAIAAEQTARRGEADAAVELAQTYEALSGPMFQRPGSRQFTAGEIRPEVDRLYGHLSVRQRASLVSRLIAPDRRPAAVARQQGVFRQQGMRAYRLEPDRFDHVEPASEAQLRRLFSNLIRSQTQADEGRFTMTRRSIRRVPHGNGFFVQMEFEGTTRGNPDPFRFHDAWPDVPSGDDPIPGDAALIERGRRVLTNPDRYAWSVHERRLAENVRRTAIAERIVAYLHHGSLDASAHDHFTRPITDRDFYTESAFAPVP